MASIDSMTKMYKICNDQVKKLRQNVKNLSKSIGDVSGVSKLVNKYKELGKTNIDKLVSKCKELGKTSIDKLVNKCKELGKTSIDKLVNKCKELGKTSVDKLVNKCKEFGKTSIDKLVNKCKELGTTDISKLVDEGKELGDVGKDETGVSKLSEKYKKLTDIVSKAKMVFDAFKKDLTIVADFQKVEQKFGNMFGGAIGDLEKGNALFDHISVKARKSSLSLEEMASNTQSFLGVASNVGQLDKLNNMAERLAVLNTTGESSSGASSAISEAMTGNYDSLTTKFNISDKEIENSGLMLNVNSGNIDGALDALDELLSKAGYSQGALDGVTGNVMTQGGMFAENLKTTFAESMSHVADIFANIMEKINGVLESGKIQPFIDGFAIGFAIVGYVVSAIVDSVIWLCDTISAGWDIVEPFLMAAAIILLPMLLVAIWNITSALVIQFSIWLWGTGLLTSPLLLVIAILGTIIFVLGQMGVTVSDVFGFIGGAIGVLLASLYNILAFIVNAILGLVESIVNGVMNAVTIVNKLFYDAGIGIMEFVQKIAKTIESIINKIPGVEVNITGGLDDFVSRLEDKRAELEKDKEPFEIYKMKMADLGNAASKGFNIGSGLYDKASGAVGNVLGKLAPNKKGGLLNEDTVLNNKGGFPSEGIPNTKLDNILEDGVMPVKNGGTGGSLDVAIDKEDIKYLKDIAERDYIAKYNASTLAPNVQITFGDIHETADANKVAGVIEKLLREEIAIVAEGI